MCLLSPVLATGPTLSTGSPVTTAVSGTSSSAPVEHGNFQARFGRYFQVDGGMPWGLAQRPWEFSEVSGWSLSNHSVSYFQGPGPQVFLKAASLSADLISPSRLLSCPGWVSWLLHAQMGRCCSSVCHIPRPCWLSSPLVSSAAGRMGLQ